MSNIYTYAFIYYNLHPVPKGGGGLGSSVPVSAVPASSPTSFLVTSIILHLPPTNSHGVTSNHQKVLPLCYFLLYHTHNRLIISLVSPWVLTPQGSYIQFAVHLVRFSSHVVQNPALCVQSPPPCGIKSPPMWYNLCLHATSRTNPEPIPKEGEAMKSHENKPKND